MDTPTSTDPRERSQIAERDTWNLADLYLSEAAWRAEKDRIGGLLPQLAAFQGRLMSSPAVLADALDMQALFDKELSRLYVYASMRADADTRSAHDEGMRQEMVQLAAAFRAHASFIEPEILKSDAATIGGFVVAEPRLAMHRFHLEDVARRAPHTLGDAEEKLLADAGPLSSAPSAIFNLLSNADFPYPTVTLSDGRTASVDHAAYADLRALPNRADRELVMSSFFGSLGTFSRTYGTTLSGELQRALFFAKARRYPSTLDASLDAVNIPRSVYTRLVDGVNRHLPVFHRYLELHRRLLGVDALCYHDLYAPIVPELDLTYSVEQAERLVVEAMAPLGEEYQAVIRRAFRERWIDMFPTVGKASGAYSEGAAYDVHPFILMNYNGKFGDVSTLAHELGHTMQSYLSNRDQPYPLAAYATFTAEVASTFNEKLLHDYMLGTVESDDARLALLGDYLEGIKGTVFRQTQFAEFELAIHEMAARGEPITGETLSRTYLEITRRYYGHDRGVCRVDDYIAHEWSFIPHFYREFYVFQYATSLTASTALAERVQAGDAEATRRYLTLLSAGGSKYPIDLLRDAGVDMTTDEPLERTMAAMTRVMDEVDGMLARRPARSTH
jgi:oligoendopeptidase F